VLPISHFGFSANSCSSLAVMWCVDVWTEWTHSCLLRHSSTSICCSLTRTICWLMSMSLSSQPRLTSCLCFCQLKNTTRRHWSVLTQADYRYISAGLSHNKNRQTLLVAILKILANKLDLHIFSFAWVEFHTVKTMSQCVSVVINRLWVRHICRRWS